MGERDERWRPASEPPEIPEGDESVTVCAAMMGPDGKWFKFAATWWPGGWGLDEELLFSNVDVELWTYLPEPPTPEQEARREMEERVLAYGAKEILLVAARRGLTPLYMGLSPDEEAIIREWAAKGGGA